MALFETRPTTDKENRLYAYTAEHALRYCPQGMSEATLKKLFEAGPAYHFQSGIERVMDAYYYHGTWDDPNVHSKVLNAWILQHGLINLMNQYRSSIGTMREHDGDWKQTKSGELIRVGHTPSRIKDSGLRMRVICTGQKQDGTPVQPDSPNYQPVEITLQQFPVQMNIINPATSSLEKTTQSVVPVMISPVTITEDYLARPASRHSVEVPVWKTLVGIIYSTG